MPPVDPGEFELISTKIQAPRVPPSLVVRTSLIDRLSDGIGPVILVRAPAGYGKSTLLAQWANIESRPVAWVQLDPSEADPVVFWRYVLAAFRRVEPGFASDAHDEVWGTAPRLEAVVVPKLLNALAERDEPIVLILDDFHRLGRSPVEATFAVLLQHIPRSLVLAVASRTEPELALPRLRARGLLAVIAIDDLRLTMDETIAAVSAFDPGLDIDTAKAIQESTEGWPAGVYLASRHGPAKSPAGPSDEIHEYVLAEMLAGVPEDDRHFLRATSILSELDPSLCDAVARTPGSGSRLRRLAQANMLLVRLDGSGSRYRYHHLLGHVLRSELESERDQQYVRTLHRRAYEWCMANGWIADAFEHAIGAGDTAKAVAIVCGNWFDFWWHGKLLTARRWLDSFSDSDFTTYPPLAVAGAMIHAYTGEASKARQLGRLARSLEWEGDPLDGSCCWESSLHILETGMCIDSNGTEALLPHAEAAFELEPEGSPWRPVLRACAGFALLNRSDDRRHDELLLEAIGPETGPFATYALGILALFSAWRGAWGTAVEYAHRAIEGIQAAGLHDTLLSGLPYAIAAQVATKEGDTDAAVALLRSAESSARHGSDAVAFDAMVLCAVIAETWVELGQYGTARKHAECGLRYLAVLDEGGRAADRLNRVIHRINEEPEDEAVAAEAVPALLSTRELQVLGLLRTGLTLEQIGERLFISRDTVKTHASRSYRKLGVHGRDEAVTEAQRLGIL